MALSFATDVEPFLAPYREYMLWRFDLTDYQAVKANAELIYGFISTDAMPPPPLPPIDAADVATFKTWMDDACPP